MKANKLFTLSFLLIFLALSSSFAQTYIASDSVSLVGVRMYPGTAEDNTYSIKVGITKTKIQEFKPTQLNEYRLADGSTYVSREVNTSGVKQRVFLKRLVGDTLTLYSYRGRDKSTYFLERDSAVLIELPKDDKRYQQVLASETKDCDAVQDPIKLMKYKDGSMTEVVSRYNNKCEAKAFPFLKFGVNVGYGSMGLGTDGKELPKDATFEKSNNAVFGVFVDAPISTSNMSLVTGAYFSKGDFYDRYAMVNENEIEVTASVASVDIPLLFRYTLPWLKIKPFVNVGGTVSFNTKNESATYVYTPTGDGEFTQSPSLNTQSIVGKRNAGYTVGGGVQYNLTYRKVIWFELRYSSLGAPNTSVDKNQLSLMTGFSF